jgi:hypothetical protein
VCTVEPLRLPARPGNVVRLELTASWKDVFGHEHSHTVLDGSFEVPEEHDLFGVPGYSLNVPSLETLAYVYTSNVLLQDTSVRQEIIGFDVTLFF